MFKKYFTLFGLLAAGVTFLAAQAPQVKMIRVSPFATVSQTVGVTTLSVSYHRPGVKGREIWGKLVPYNEVWRSGANNATVFTFSDDVLIAGTTLKAGSYSFFTVPGENQWTVIFNSVADQWGAYSYDSTKNVLKFTVTPEQSPNEEWLSYSFSDLSASSATVTLRWEKIAVSFVVNTNTVANVKKIESSFVSAAAQQSATFARNAFDTKSDWDEAMAAIDRAVILDRTFSNVSLKAQLYAQKEMWADAVKTGTDALEIGKAVQANTESFEKQLKEWKEKVPAAKKKKK